MIENATNVTAAPARVAVIIVNWRSPESTAKAIRSAQRQRHVAVRVFVVDNSSGDDSVEVLTEEFGDSIALIRSTTNLGFGRGVNLGIAVARGHGFDYVVLLNSDAVMAPDSVAAFVDWMDVHTDVGVCGGQVLRESSGALEVAGGGGIDWLGGATILGPRTDLAFVTGAFMCIRCSVIEAGIVMPSEYFMYWEDVAFSRRVLKRGWLLGYCADAVAHHVGNGSLGPRSAAFDAFIIESGVRFFLREDGFHPWSAYILVARTFFRRLLRGPRENVPFVVRAALQGLRPQPARFSTSEGDSELQHLS